MLPSVEAQWVDGHCFQQLSLAVGESLDSFVQVDPTWIKASWAERVGMAADVAASMLLGLACNRGQVSHG
jgi:hypothetical protein